MPTDAIPPTPMDECVRRLESVVGQPVVIEPGDPFAFYNPEKTLAAIEAGAGASESMDVAPFLAKICEARGHRAGHRRGASCGGVAPDRSGSEACAETYRVRGGIVLRVREPPQSAIERGAGRIRGNRARTHRHRGYERGRAAHVPVFLCAIRCAKAARRIAALYWMGHIVSPCPDCRPSRRPPPLRRTRCLSIIGSTPRRSPLCASSASRAPSKPRVRHSPCSPSSD